MTHALVQLVEILKQKSYHFRAITPESHSRVLSRPHHPSSKLSPEERAIRDLFGWSKSVSIKSLPERVLSLLEESGHIAPGDAANEVRSHVRASTLDGQIFWHSAYPTLDAHSVFFGPDTYRFVRFLKAHVEQAHRVVDIGCGSGAGGLSLRDRVSEFDLVDVNEKALELAKLNAEINSSTHANVYSSNILSRVKPGADLLIANPPYIYDSTAPTYAHGGDDFGTDISVNIVEAALDYLKPEGRLLMYTGACVVDGEDVFWARLQPHLSKKIASGKVTVSYEEIDPDVFGEELSTSRYQEVDRIAAVGLILTLK